MIHSLFFIQKKFRLTFLTMILLSGILSCNSGKTSQEDSTDSVSEPGYADTSPVTVDTMMAPAPTEDSIVNSSDSELNKPREEIIKENPIKNPAEVSGIKIAKGNAMVYCPAKMIEGIPSIANATITKEEISAALIDFREKMRQENPELSVKEINTNIKNESIDLYERMGVKLEFDPDVFKISPKEASVTKSFGNKQQLEWDWEITPLHTTEKSFVHFKFYYEDPTNNSIQEILDKRISVDVKVDSREYVDKWKEFILGDPKNTTTAILIPLVTFLGGFLTGKKNKKAS